MNNLFVLVFALALLPNIALAFGTGNLGEDLVFAAVTIVVLVIAVARVAFIDIYKNKNYALWLFIAALLLLFYFF